MQKEIKTYCYYAPSLGALEGTPKEAWGTEPYDYRRLFSPTVFFGLYDVRDYFALASHRGKKWVLWAGSDIRNLADGFAFNDGKLRKLSTATRGKFTPFVVKHVLADAEHWTENMDEARLLEKVGVKVTGVCPSYMGPVGHITTYRPSKRPSVYLSSSEGRQREYGFDTVERIAGRLPKFDFHLYGASWTTEHENVTVHGRIPKEQMNKETSRMQIGLRCNGFDGFSEITAKAVLRGQYAITKVEHPVIPNYADDDDLVAKLKVFGTKEYPNLRAKNWYEKNLNQYPWNINY